jgi:hypothetical protein
VDSVDPAVQEYVDRMVDGPLSAGCALFPDVAPGGDVIGGEPAAPPKPPAGGALADGVTAVSGDYERAQSDVQGLDEMSRRAAAAAGEEGFNARSRAVQVRESARVRASAILPHTNSPAGMKLLVSTMDEQLRALQREVDTTKKANAAFADQLREAADGYRRLSAPPA